MSCILGRVVFKDDAFHDIIWILLLVVWFCYGKGGGGICGNGGGVYIHLEVQISLMFHL